MLIKNIDVNKRILVSCPLNCLDNNPQWPYKLYGSQFNNAIGYEENSSICAAA